MDRFDCEIIFSLNNMSCIKILNQYSDYLAFMSMVVTAMPVSIIFCFFMWKNYQTSSIKWKEFIANLMIDFIHLTLLINLGLIIETIDHLEKIIKSK